MSNVPGTTVLLDDRFALPSQPLFAGGHARLYKAYDLKAGKEVAVKVFSPASQVDDRVLALAWTNELDLYDRLGAHSNLLELVAYGAPHEGTPWIAFEWCGQDLQSHIEGSVPSWDLFSPVAMEILGGLGALHAKGFVHRDIKLKNIDHEPWSGAVRHGKCTATTARTTTAPNRARNSRNSRGLLRLASRVSFPGRPPRRLSQTGRMHEPPVASPMKRGLSTDAMRFKPGL